MQCLEKARRNVNVGIRGNERDVSRGRSNMTKYKKIKGTSYNSTGEMIEALYEAKRDKNHPEHDYAVDLISKLWDIFLNKMLGKPLTKKDEEKIKVIFT